jgi:uncharacterized protein involved in response to NO
VSEPSSERSPPLIDRLRDEPFRLFFPLGVLASIWGAMLWPAYYAKWMAWYPLEAHARLMVTGFAGCFIVGFLGTAGPRLVGAKPFRRWEFTWHALLAVVVMGCLALNRVALGDLLTGLWLLGVLGSLGYRLLRERDDVPPPGFPVALAAILLGALAAIYLGAVGHGWVTPTDFSYSLSRLVLFQGLIWWPVVGVAPFILPRFFGRKSEHGFEESLSIPKGWWNQSGFSLAAAGLIGVSFVMEANGMLVAGQWVRAAIVLGYLPAAIPGLLERTDRGALVLAIRLSFLGGVAGWIVAACYPHTRIGSLHLGFIGGGGLLMLVVATRVILGHGGRHDRLAGRMKLFHVVTGLAILAATTRTSADFLPAIKVSHFIYAAISWVAVVGFWGWWLRREAKAPELDRSQWAPSKCPKRKK